MMPMTQGMGSDKKIFYGMSVLVLAGLMAAGWFGYSWYVRNKEQAAYKDLAESIEGYVKTAGYGFNTEKLMDSERAFGAGAEKHTTSKLHPFFLAYQADALVQQDKHKEAAALFDKVINEIDRKHPLYFLYALKRALIKMDTGDAALVKQGRDELETLARDTANPLQDMALYHSGLDAEMRGDKVLAEQKFQEIIKHDKKQSYWHHLAQSRMRSGAQ